MEQKSSTHFYRPMTYSLNDEELMNKKVEVSVEVSQLIINQGMVHTSLVLKEVDWFFNRVGIDDSYFATTPANDIAKHISSIYAGKIISKNQEVRHEFHIAQEDHDRAFFIVRSDLSSSKSTTSPLEQRLDTEYLRNGYGAKSPKVDIPWRMKVFRSTGSILEDIDIQLRFYLLHKPTFPDVSGIKDLENETDINKIADLDFLKRSSDNTKLIYQDLISKAANDIGPLLHLTEVGPEEDERRLVVCYRSDSVHSLCSAITDLYHYHKLYSTKKFVEHFANGMTIISCYMKLNPIRHEGNFDHQTMNEVMNSFLRDLYLVYVLPRTSLTPFFQDLVLSPRETIYGYVCWKFAHQFLSRYQREYSALMSSISKGGDTTLIGHLLKLKQNLRKDTFTEDRVFETIKEYPQVIKMLFADFESRFHPDLVNKERIGHPCTLPDLSLIEASVNRMVKSDFDLIVLSALINMNKHILKTNFFKKDNVALAFRFDPRFLSSDEYPNRPFGVFFVLGSEFRGFHVRFQEVARGGIRIIRSSNAQVYAQNVGSIFDENYNLANTQQMKNKDIPEGGSKGTIFLHYYHQDKGLVAFRKYVDSLLDLLLPHPEVIDYLGSEEILFLGPDEGTAEFMDWASQYARSRGAHFWKAITTGKSQKLGGIPHDTFGMTTRSIHQYVLGVLEKLQLKESSVSKLQTGGPDGDLGSNEIKISSDKTVAIIDGSGVLYDPEGINRSELLRLAEARLMSCHFDKKFLSSKGYFIHVDDREIALPNGEIVPNGMIFRNTFHLNPAVCAQLFVPCGGRPESVNVNNVSSLFDSDGSPRFKIIVEGANLFFTQEARLILENKGVIIYKDAAANKGGVTSSSLEVLAALALTDEEFNKLMQVHDIANPPEFYKKYVKDVQFIIEKNARLEFECIWEEHIRTGEPRCIISDQLSCRINRLNNELRNSSLWSNMKLRRAVIANACPKILIDTITIETLMQRVPDPYLQAIFGAHLASTFIYKYGLQSSEFAFFDFMENYLS